VCKIRDIEQLLDGANLLWELAGYINEWGGIGKPIYQDDL